MVTQSAPSVHQYPLGALLNVTCAADVFIPPDPTRTFPDYWPLAPGNMVYALPGASPVEGRIGVFSPYLNQLCYLPADAVARYVPDDAPLFSPGDVVTLVRQPGVSFRPALRPDVPLVVEAVDKDSVVVCATRAGGQRFVVDPVWLGKTSAPGVLAPQAGDVVRPYRRGPSDYLYVSRVDGDQITLLDLRTHSVKAMHTDDVFVVRRPLTRRPPSFTAWSGQTDDFFRSNEYAFVFILPDAPTVEPSLSFPLQGGAFRVRAWPTGSPQHFTFDSPDGSQSFEFGPDVFSRLQLYLLPTLVPRTVDTPAPVATPVSADTTSFVCGESVVAVRAGDPAGRALVSGDLYVVREVGAGVVRVTHVLTGRQIPHWYDVDRFARQTR